MTEMTVNPPDVETVDGIIKALYETVSFEKGAEPDWRRMQSLFLADAIFVPPALAAPEAVKAISLETFRDITRERISAGAGANGFFEHEVERSEVAFGNVVHVVSSFESRIGSEEDVVVVRGINSIQLVFDGRRYWVASIVWDNERDVQQR